MSLTTVNRPMTAMSVLFYNASVQNGGVYNHTNPFNNPFATRDDREAQVSYKMNTEDEVDNCTDEVDGNINSKTTGKNGIVKAFAFGNRFPQSTNADGSLPTSPDSQPTIPNFPPSYTELECETQELIGNVYRIRMGLSRTGPSKHRVQSTLWRVLDDIIAKHQIAYNGMVQKLNLKQQPDDMSFVSIVAKSMFSDGTTNWGRVASLVAFGAVLCQHLAEIQREHCVDAVVRQISSFLTTDQHTWFINNKGWDGFADFFHVEDPESAVRSTLIAVAGMAGLGALGALLIR